MNNKNLTALLDRNFGALVRGRKGDRVSFPVEVSAHFEVDVPLATVLPLLTGKRGRRRFACTLDRRITRLVTKRRNELTREVLAELKRGTAP